MSEIEWELTYKLRKLNNETRVKLNQMIRERKYSNENLKLLKFCQRTLELVTGVEKR